jgi:hypothetical protein
MRPKHVVVVLGVLLVGLVTGVALATPGSGATSTLFSAGTFTRDAHARQSENADAQIVDVAVRSRRVHGVALPSGNGDRDGEVGCGHAQAGS